MTLGARLGAQGSMGPDLSVQVKAEGIWGFRG